MDKRLPKCATFGNSIWIEPKLRSVYWKVWDEGPELLSHPTQLTALGVRALRKVGCHHAKQKDPKPLNARLCQFLRFNEHHHHKQETIQLPKLNKR